ALAVTAVTGVIWALIAATISAWWFSDIKLGLIFGSAMIINLIIAAFTGAFLPLFLKALKIDPALAGGVGLVALTDVVGFLSFLGLAAWMY
ncbi:MAG: magnesium transporter, partial [Gammaproteobacteria bacterium]